APEIFCRGTRRTRDAGGKLLHTSTTPWAEPRTKASTDGDSSGARQGAGTSTAAAPVAGLGTRRHDLATGRHDWGGAAAAGAHEACGCSPGPAGGDGSGQAAGWLTPCPPRRQWRRGGPGWLVAPPRFRGPGGGASPPGQPLGSAAAPVGRSRIAWGGTNGAPGSGAPSRGKRGGGVWTASPVWRRQTAVTGIAPERPRHGSGRGAAPASRDGS